MSLLIDKSQTISQFINDKYDPKLVFSQAFQMRLFTHQGYEWYILDYDRESNIAIGMINQNDPKNASIGQIDLTTMDNLEHVQIDYDYVPENINRLFTRLRSL